MRNKATIKKLRLIRESEQKKIVLGLLRAKAELEQKTSFIEQLDQYSDDYSKTKVEKGKSGLNAASLQSLDAFGARLRATSNAQKLGSASLRVRVQSLTTRAKSLSETVSELDRVIKEVKKAEIASAELQDVLDREEHVAAKVKLFGQE